MMGEKVPMCERRNRMAYKERERDRGRRGEGGGGRG